MKKLLLTLTCLSLALTALAAAFNFHGVGFSGNVVPAANASFNPTNVFQDIWFPSAETYVTNSGVATLINTGTRTYNLTNQYNGVYIPPRNVSALNGYDTISYDPAVSTGQNLSAKSYTNTQPNEVWLVLKWVALGNYGYFFDGGTSSSTAQQAATLAVNGTNDLHAGTLLGGYSMTNLLGKWIVYRAVFNAGSSAIYTNNVLMVAGNSGTNSANGLTLGTSYSYASPTKTDYAYVMTVGSNLDNTTAASAFAWLTNRFALSP